VSREEARTAVERLADDLVPLGGSLRDETVDWLGESRRFRSFAELNRDKIRKKLRGATDEDARLDVRAELRVASLLLGDRRIELAFEAYGARRPGPDFSLIFRAAPSMNVEVTRPRTSALAGPLLTKLHQLPPSHPNLVVLSLGGASAAADVAATVRDLRARADARDDPYFAARGFEGARGFYQRHLRLGGVIGWREGQDATLWVNRSARIPLPEPATRAVVACLGG
jgi:hypothetical protein